MVDGWPNETRFTSKVGRIVQQAALKGPVRIFGEMVAVLCAEVKMKAAIRLEELWNELAAKHEFALLGGYPISSFQDQNDESFHQVCRTHTYVRTSA
jgi:hypothetical protein